MCNLPSPERKGETPASCTTLSLVLFALGTRSWQESPFLQYQCKALVFLHVPQLPFVWQERLNSWPLVMETCRSLPEMHKYEAAKSFISSIPKKGHKPRPTASLGLILRTAPLPLTLEAAPDRALATRVMTLGTNVPHPDASGRRSQDQEARV